MDNEGTHIDEGFTAEERGERQTESPNLQAMALQVRSCKTSCKTFKVKTKTACDNVSVCQYSDTLSQAKLQNSDLQVKNLQADFIGKHLQVSNFTGEEEYTGQARQQQQKSTTSLTASGLPNV